MMTLLLAMIFSSSYFDTTWSNAYPPFQWVLNNRIWVKPKNNISDGIKKIQDSLHCSSNYCSEKRGQVFSEADIAKIKSFDSAIAKNICGTEFHIATLADFKESNNTFRFIDAYVETMYIPNVSPGMQVFYNEQLKELRYFTSNSSSKVDLSNDTGFSIYRTTYKSGDPNWIIALPIWGERVPYNTVCVSDFLVDSSPTQKDTLKIVDSFTVLDTVTKYIRDTVLKRDSVKYIDSIFIRDTVTKYIRDTIKISVRDTLWRLDTTYLHDTVNISTCKDDFYSEVLYNSRGSKDQFRSGLAVRNSSENSIAIQIKSSSEVKIEAYVYDNIGTYVTSGKFEISDTRDGKYITFGGYSENGTVCADGVYLIRVIARGKNLFRNTVYKVGLKG